jgi:hypothetical protein
MQTRKFLLALSLALAGLAFLYFDLGSYLSLPSIKAQQRQL